MLLDFFPVNLARSVDSLRSLIDEGRRQAQVIRSDPATSVSVIKLLGGFFSDSTKTRGDLLTVDSLANFRDGLFDSFGSTYGNMIGASTSGRGRPRQANEDALGRAVDVVENQNQKTTMMADLVKSANVSETSLRIAFHRYLGLSPRDYIRLRKFNLIWRELNYGDADGTTVARVIAEFGISDMGRFASRFRGIFGENPSVTLKREKPAD